MNFTVVIPTFNRSEALRVSIQSILNQSIDSFEIIVVNDDKDDIGIEQLVNSFQNRKIQYSLNKGTRGAPGARNTGIDLARGEYICFLDDDDQMAVDCLKNILEEIGKNRKNVYCTSYVLKTEEFCHKTILEDELTTHYDYTRLNKSLCTGSTLCVNRNFIKDKNIRWDENLERFQDIQFTLNLLEHSSIYFLANPQVIINGRINSKVDLKKLQRSLTNLELWIKNRSNFKEKEKEYNFLLANQAKNISSIAISRRKYRFGLYYLRRSFSYSALPLKKYVVIIFSFLNSFGLNGKKYYYYFKSLVNRLR